MNSCCSLKVLQLNSSSADYTLYILHLFTKLSFEDDDYHILQNEDTSFGDDDHL